MLLSVQTNNNFILKLEGKRTKISTILSKDVTNWGHLAAGWNIIKITAKIANNHIVWINFYICSAKAISNKENKS